ncbi:LysR substrate-binding domain-containing protein [Escherichia coli]|nr:LysR substrate-binding domain-containing protein [Escherichia coli]MDO2777561.1 LysR substrate-binding domain-containing protein [Escherichia coli]
MLKKRTNGSVRYCQYTSKWVLPVTCFGYYNNLTEFLRRAGVNIDNAIRTDSISSIINLVSCADYVTVLAKPMGDGRNKKLSLRPIRIKEQLPSADYYLTWSKKYIPSRLLSEFMRIIKARCSVSVWGE